MSNAAFTSTGKPKIGGAISVATVGTALPTTATETLDPSFQLLGYCSDDGLTNSNSIESSTINAWGGDPVIVMQTGMEDTWKFKLLEIMNMVVLQFVYGASNVSGDLTNGIILTANSEERPEVSMVVDMILQGNVFKRVVIPRAKISEMGDVVYKDDEAAGYDVTVSCTPDTAGNTHYEYLKKVPTTASYTVTFNSNGGTAVASQVVQSGGKVTEPAAPVKEGYTFGAWYADAAFTDAWDFATDTVSANMTLHAKWGYQVSFNSNGGSSVTSQVVVPGGKVSEPSDPTKQDYTFAGWYSDAELTTAWTFATDTVNAAMTLYAKWTA